MPRYCDDVPRNFALKIPVLAIYLPEKYLLIQKCLPLASVAARKVVASAADQAAIAKVADSVFFSAGGGLIQTTSG